MKLYQVALGAWLCSVLSPLAYGAIGQNEKELLEASLRGDQERVAAFLAAGANVNFQDTDGNGALLFAAWKGNVGIVRLLLNAGADPDCLDNRGWTPLMQAVFNYRIPMYGTPVCPEIVRLLLDAGADVHHKDEEGRTAIMHALRKDCRFCPENIAMLRWAGASFEAHKFPYQSHLERQQSQQLEMIKQRYLPLVRELLTGYESSENLPREISRLIGELLGLSEAQNLPKPVYKK